MLCLRRHSSRSRQTLLTKLDVQQSTLRIALERSAVKYLPKKTLADFRILAPTAPADVAFSVRVQDLEYEKKALLAESGVSLSSSW